MNNSHNAHPDDGDLLRYLDGELAAAESDSVRRHLDACWSCRMHADGIQTAIVEFARLRERTVLPDPPRPWKDLTPDLFQMEESATHRSVWSRLGLFFAVAIGVAAATWLVLPHKPPKIELKSFPKPAAIERAAPALASQPAIAKLILPKILEATPPTGLHEELAVIAALHRLEADLGEPIDLERNTDGAGLTLKAFGLPPDRQQSIRLAMRGFHWLRLNFEDPSNEGVHAAAEHSLTTARRPIAFEEKLLKHLGSKRALEQLTNSVLDLSDQILTRAHALDKLDKRFRGSIGRADDDVLLASIRADHRRALSEAAADLERSMEPVFRALDIESRTSPQTTLFETTSRLDQLVNSALAGAQSDLSDPDLYSELRTYLARLMELTAA